MHVLAHIPISLPLLAALAIVFVLVALWPHDNDPFARA